MFFSRQIAPFMQLHSFCCATAEPFARLEYVDAVRILQNCGHKFTQPVRWVICWFLAPPCALCCA